MSKVLDVDGGSRQVLAVLSQSTNCYFCLLRLEIKVPAIYFKWLEKNEVREGEKIYKTIRGWISTSLEAVFVCVHRCCCGLCKNGRVGLGGNFLSFAMIIVSTKINFCCEVTSTLFRLTVILIGLFGSICNML